MAPEGDFRINHHIIHSSSLLYPSIHPTRPSPRKRIMPVNVEEDQRYCCCAGKDDIRLLTSVVRPERGRLKEGVDQCCSL